MNTKTTVFLAFILLIAVGGLYVVKTRPPAEAKSAAPVEPSQTATRKVFEDDLGEIVKVTVAKAGAEPLVFEKKKDADSAAGPTWHVTAPFEAKATSWEIDRIPRDIAQLSYEISYKSGESGSVTSEQAGLAPPTAVITLANDAGKEVKLEVGKPASSGETYVRVAGGDAILVAKSRVAELIKKAPAEYRDAQVWSFEPANVKRVEIVDRAAGNTGGQAASGTQAAGEAKEAGAATTYVFVREGDKWMMESPVTARATAKVDDALKAVSKLRVLKWEPQAQSRAAGLDPAAVTATFTVEEKVPVEKPAEEQEETPEGEEKPEEPATEIRTSAYTLHISSLSPIGEDTKTYVRVGDQTVVGTIMKTVADKVKPVMNEWREMRLITDDATKASKVELTVAGESATLSKTADGWQFEGGGKADAAEVTKLLETVGKLHAVVFLEPGEGQASEQGLDAPRATIALTIPGVEGERRLTIGGPTDPQTKRMAYVRRDDANTVAKVLEAELATLLRGPTAYQDRAVLSIPADQVQRLTIIRENPFSKQRETVSLERADGVWRMTEPVAAETRQAKVQELVDGLAALQADRIVPQAEAGAVAAKLEAQSAQLTLNVTYRPPAEAPAVEGADVPAPGPEVTKTLALALVDGKAYGKVADQPTLFELPNVFAERLKAEYREGTVLKFAPEDVTKFSVKEGGTADTFLRQNEKWVYEAEPDLPLDQAKVAALLGQFQNLQTEAFATHTAADPASYGLDAPEREARITLADGELVLAVSSMASEVPAKPGHFASSSQTEGVFLMPAATLQQMHVDLDALGAS